MIGKNTEKAIRKWLSLDIKLKYVQFDSDSNALYLMENTHQTAVAKISLRSIIAKRYPRKKKAVRK
jgi:hypothetical protein